MKNIKGFAIANDGTMKRIAITYDEIDEKGTIINANVKVNRIVTEEKATKAIEQIAGYAQSIVDAEE